MTSGIAEVSGYAVPLDRYYHPSDNTWVRIEGELCRVGMDVLGQETSGDLAQLALVTPGTDVHAGTEMGSLEAQKFVGALRAPISGTVVAVNGRLFDDPQLVNRDPFGEGWLLMIRPSEELPGELAGMIAGEKIAGWFDERVRQARLMGILAE